MRLSLGKWWQTNNLQLSQSHFLTPTGKTPAINSHTVTAIKNMIFVMLHKLFIPFPLSVVMVIVRWHCLLPLGDTNMIESIKAKFSGLYAGVWFNNIGCNTLGMSFDNPESHCRSHLKFIIQYFLNPKMFTICWSSFAYFPTFCLVLFIQSLSKSFIGNFLLTIIHLGSKILHTFFFLIHLFFVKLFKVWKSKNSYTATKKKNSTLQ